MPTPATVLGGAEAQKLGDALDDYLMMVPDEEYPTASGALDSIEPVVAGLISAAREAGAAAERERIHGEIADRQHAELAATIPPAGSPTQAYDYARQIARGAA
jgi:hypothetical protein